MIAKAQEASESVRIKEPDTDQRCHWLTPQGPGSTGSGGSKNSCCLVSSAHSCSSEMGEPLPHTEICPHPASSLSASASTSALHRIQSLYLISSS